MDPDAQFLFVTCQVGAERAVKSEFARQWPTFRFAYSRPGFLTFKLPPPYAVPDDFDPQSVFARTFGMSLGKVSAAGDDELAQAAWQIAAGRPFDCLHVWQRDARAAGDHGYDPGPTEAAIAARAALVHTAPEWATNLVAASATAKTGDLVLDCVLVDAGQWWIGFHRARAGASSRAGGYYELTPPADMVSRAYLKMAEALDWSILTSGFLLGAARPRCR